MQSANPLTNRLRQILVIIGFGFFVLFVYQASHDVSNQQVATGVPRLSPAFQDTAQKPQSSLGILSAAQADSASTVISSLAEPPQNSAENSSHPIDTSKQVDKKPQKPETRKPDRKLHQD